MQSSLPKGELGGQEDAQSQILAAIRGLADRLSKIEAQRQVPPVAGDSVGTSPRDLQAYQESQADHPDSISLYAQGSLLGDGDHLEPAEESQCLNLSHTGGSVSADDDNEDASLSHVVSVAKIIGLSVPVEAPSSSEGVWAGISQSRPSVAIPAAGDYCQILKKSWNAPASAPQFNSGCRRLAKAQYPPESGLGDMPPVEREMAALTPLVPDRVTINPRQDRLLGQQNISCSCTGCSIGECTCRSPSSPQKNCRGG